MLTIIGKVVKIKIKHISYIYIYFPINNNMISITEENLAISKIK